jgi:hypothetical protein
MSKVASGEKDLHGDILMGEIGGPGVLWSVPARLAEWAGMLPQSK